MYVAIPVPCWIDRSRARYPRTVHSPGPLPLPPHLSTAHYSICQMSFLFTRNNVHAYCKKTHDEAIRFLIYFAIQVKWNMNFLTSYKALDLSCKRPWSTMECRMVNFYLFFDRKMLPWCCRGCQLVEVAGQPSTLHLLSICSQDVFYTFRNTVQYMF
jgi:hypothetical protein